MMKYSPGAPSHSLTSLHSPGCGRSVGTHRHHRSQRPSCMYLLFCLMCWASRASCLLSGNDGAIVCLFFSIREPRVTEEVRGRWCVVLFDKSFFCLLYALIRTISAARRQHIWLSLPWGPFIPYCLSLFVVTLPVTLGCRGVPVRVINTGRVHILSLLRGWLSAHAGIIHCVEIRFHV